MINYSDLYYYGKPITELSKEELIKVIVYILQKHEEYNEELYKKILDLKNEITANSDIDKV